MAKTPGFVVWLQRSPEHFPTSGELPEMERLTFLVGGMLSQLAPISSDTERIFSPDEFALHNLLYLGACN
jgi:hypothetical protein